MNWKINSCSIPQGRWTVCLQLFMEHPTEAPCFLQPIHRCIKRKSWNYSSQIYSEMKCIHRHVKKYFYSRGCQFTSRADLRASFLISSTRNPWMPSCSSPLWNIPLDISCNMISGYFLLMWLMLSYNARMQTHCSRRNSLYLIQYSEISTGQKAAVRAQDQQRHSCR